MNRWSKIVEFGKVTIIIAGQTRVPDGVDPL